MRDTGREFCVRNDAIGQGIFAPCSRMATIGYHFILFFLGLPTPEVAIARVAERVRQGGHNISEPVIRRRLVAGKANFDRYYCMAVDAWVLYDSSGDEPVLIEWGER